MKKILILINNDGGLYHFRKELLEVLVQKGYEVIVSVPQGKYREQIEKLGCAYIPIDIDRHGMNPIKDGKLFLQYGRLIKRCRPDTILTYTIKPNIYGAIQARMRKVPYMVNITGLGTALQKEGLTQKILINLYRFALKKAACVFFQNEQNLKFMTEQGCVNTKTRLIPGSGVNIEEYEMVDYPEENTPARILNITRIMRDKGIEEFLDAVVKVKNDYPNTIFEIIGDYELDEKYNYESRIEELQKQGIINYYGYQKDVRPFIRRCHLLVNPTYHEGMSNVLQEAAASGRPVAASDISGCKEIFENDKSGFVFEVQNTEALIRTMEKFLNLRYEERKAMGKEARKYIEKNFDRKIVIQAYLDELNIIEKRIK